MSGRRSHTSKGSQMKIILSIIALLVVGSFAQDTKVVDQDRAPEVSLSFDIPTPKVERDSVAHVTAPKSITFDNFVKVKTPRHQEIDPKIVASMILNY